MRRTWTSFALASCLLVAASACKKSETAPPAPAPAPATIPLAAAPAPPSFRVVSVDLGKAIGPDKKVTQPASAFAPSDTIYAVVATEGASPNVALGARWTYGDGQLVNENSQSIAPTGPAATEFHIARPSGWPTGKYKVEISANGSVVSAKEFVVN